MNKLVIACTALVALLTAAAPPAFAQSRPFQGLFGAIEAPTPQRSLDLTTSVFGVHDTNLPRLVPHGLGEDPTPEVRYSDLHASLWFTNRGLRTSFAANGAATVQYYPQLANAVRWSGAGAIALRRTTPRVSFGISQEGRYSPYTHFRVIPIPIGTDAGLGQVAASDVALAVSGDESYRINTGVSLGLQLTRGMMLNTSYLHEYFDFVEVGAYNWRRQDANVGISYRLSPTTAFEVGYAYHERDFESDRIPLRRHDFNVGVNYNNTLPFSPQTTFTFGVGSTMLARDRTTTVLDANQSIVRLIGNADLQHRLGRTWRVGLHYDRSVQYIEGIHEVFLAHSVTANIGGYLSPRVDVRATTGYSTAPLRYSPRQRGYDMNASTARMRIAISRGFAAQAEYVHYRYLFSDAVTVPTGIPVRGNRHVVRVGLTTWFPLLN